MSTEQKKDNKLIQLPTSSTIENVKHEDLVIKNEVFQLPFYRNNFLDFKDYVKFIKEVEKVIRTSDDYKHYIAYLKMDIGLDYCQVFPKIDDEKASIEMHHGPILTLYDYVDIVTNYHCKRKDDFTTLSIAEEVLEEHYQNRVQIVMVSKSVHQAIHTGKVFIHPRQAWGNLNAFLEKYDEGLTKEHRESINNYIIMSNTVGTNDNGLLEVREIEDWNRDKFEKLTSKKIKKELEKEK